MTILHLPTSAYEGPAQLTLPRTSALTHEAWIRAPGQAQALRAVVKVHAPQDGAHTRELLNEFIGHFLAESLAFPVPSPAGTITLARRHWGRLPFWRALPAGTREVVAWWSSRSPLPSIAARFDLEELRERHPLFEPLIARIRAELMAAPAVPGIVAFDELIANIDRNIGNLLGPKNARYLLIDHGRCLTGGAWKAADLVPGRACTNVLRDLLGGDALPLSFKSAAADTFDRIQPKLPATMVALRRELSDLLDTSEADAVVAFLRDRARRDTAARRMGCLV